MDRIIHETIMILHEDLTKETYNGAVTTWKKIIKALPTVTDIKTEKLGKKKLAYKIKESKYGWYILFTYKASPDVIHDLDQLIRVDDKVLKFMTVRADGKEYEPDTDSDFNQDAEKSEQPEIKIKKPIDVFDLIFGIDN